MVSAFWGFTKKAIDELDLFQEELKLPYWIILAIGRPDRFVADGYIVTKLGWPPMLRHPKLHENDSFKINEKTDLDVDHVIRSAKSIAKSLKEAIRTYKKS